jgi:uncharacterized repeat protein (TIGR01451 family)
MGAKAYDRGLQMTANFGIRMAGWLALGIASLAYPFAAAAQSGGVEIDTSVYKEVAAANGGVERVPAERAVPGDEVLYVITYRNSGDEAATNVAINNELPDEIVLASTEDDPTAVSVDNGQTFGRLGELTVITDEGDVRQAQWADVTNLRWIVDSLAPGASGSVSYRARVR